VRIEVRAQAFDPWVEIDRYQTGVLNHQQSRYGATAVFVGTMRDVNEAAAVHAMTLEHYPGMTERHLQRITEEAMGRWDIIDILILHRVGELHPGEPIVLIAVWSAHRAAAFEACRFLIEDLKSRAPFWKKERLDAGFRWVEKSTPG
jgi:molybdopterin synthase catalytic subunit